MSRGRPSTRLRPSDTNQVWDWPSKSPAFSKCRSKKFSPLTPNDMPFMKTTSLLPLLLFLLHLTSSAQLESAVAGPKPDGDKGVAGFWQGVLKPTPAIELRVVLEITNAVS